MQINHPSTVKPITSAIANLADLADFEKATAPVLSSLLDFAAPIETEALSLLRITDNETPVIPFTAQVEKIKLHYCDEPEITGYVQCHGDGCILCAIGRKPDERLLNPVYAPSTGDISVLAITPSMRPHALLPQYLPHLSANERRILFVQKAGMAKFRLTARPLPADVDDGRAVVEAFMARWQAGEVRLADVYSVIDNATLMTIPAIARLAQLKGLKG